jgi:hypothetical protein
MQMTKRKRPGKPAPAEPVPVEVSPGHRDELTGAYQAGMIVAWKHDVERGFRLSFAGRADEYVEVNKLSSYLARLKGAA